MCSGPTAEGVDGLTQGLGAGVVLAVARVRQAVQGLFAVRLAQQRVEAVVEAGAEAEVGRVAGTVQGVLVVSAWHAEQMLVLVVAGGLVDVVLLERSKQSCLVLVR